MSPLLEFYNFSTQMKSFLEIFWRTSAIFVEPLIPLFWTSGDICPGFQSQGGFPHLHALLPLLPIQYIIFLHRKIVILH